jgi:aromatic ring-cleaving dioxygenase
MSDLTDLSVPREWHFHVRGAGSSLAAPHMAHHVIQVYFDQGEDHLASAVRDRVLALVERGQLVARCLPLNHGPRGPHPVGSFETWVPIEHFATAFAFFVQFRGNLDVLVHALTRREVLSWWRRVGA